MLMLTRKAGEKIVLDLGGGQLVTVVVTRIVRDNQVQIGIAAPRDVPIMRGELLARKGASK